MPGGRPTKYNAEKHLPLVMATAGTGATLRMIAVACDVDTATVKRWMKEHTEFCAVVTRAREMSDALPESKLYSLANSGDMKAIAMWLNNRAHDEWRDKQAIEITGKDGGPVEVDVTDAFTRLDAAIARVTDRRAAGEGAQDSEAD
jgi:hypothetical protein